MTPKGQTLMIVGEPITTSIVFHLIKQINIHQIKNHLTDQGEIVINQIQTTEHPIGSKANRQTLHPEIEIPKKLTIIEDLIDSKGNRQTPHLEIKILRKLTITEDRKIKNLFLIRKVLTKH